MAKRGTYVRAKGSAGRQGHFVIVIVVFCTMITVGIIFSMTMAPRADESSSGPGTNSLVSEYGPLTLSHKIMDWMPGKGSHRMAAEKAFPDWSRQFWNPIDLDTFSRDPEVTLCKLNFKKYSESPHLYPMFRDFEGVSDCHGNNRRRERMSTLMRELKDAAAKGLPEGRVVAPTAFVFHESRVGSTLVANSLASDPFSMVYSESAPAANALLHCKTCPDEESINLFRDIVTLMGRSPIHKRLFFKFQSITCTRMHIALKAFPETPWVFVYRRSVQTMMSHLDPKKGGGTGAPCLRSMRDTPDEVRKTLVAAGTSTSNAPKEAWCAAHLNMLCSHAVDSYERFGRYNDTHQRGFLVNYESLPGSIARLLLPSFGVEPSDHWLERMAEESKQYSKGRSSSRPFFGDSQDKEERATKMIQKYAASILDPTFERIAEISASALRQMSPELFERISTKGEDGHIEVNWQLLKEVPVTLADSIPAAALEMNNLRRRHSQFKTNEYEPWAPFANTHSSRPFAAADCPPTPAPDYPVTYSMYSEILQNWNTDSTEIPPFHYDSLCHFDFRNKTQQEQALVYRKAERPFVVYNIPEVDEVVRKWNNVDYLHKKLGSKKYRTETSKTNHFMYWYGKKKSKSRLRNGKMWEPPTQVEELTFDSWLETAVKGQNTSLEDRTHQYFRVSSDADNEWLFNELPFFKPKPSLMIVDPKEQQGIHCRFGMRSVIAEVHFDGARNAVVMLGGMRRWILTHPNQCEFMHMLPKGHPSARHSEVDWSKPDVEQFPNFIKVRGNEVILQPGDFLYVPTYWIHYIVSLNVNFQCNTRSGATDDFNEDIIKCGF